MTYKISLDTTAKILTISILLFVVLITVGVWSPIAIKGLTPRLASTSILLSAFGLTYLFRPQRYTVTENDIIVNRLIGNIKLFKTDIHSAEKIEGANLSWSLRTFGSSGFFGYFGKFTNRKIGAMTWYVTRKDSLVLIKMKNGKKIILSPDERDEFLAEINY